MDALAAGLGGTWFYSRVAGVTSPNEDGSSRREAIDGLHQMDQLTIEHEAISRFDNYSPRVLDPQGRQIGYIPQQISGDVLRGVRSGMGYAFVVSSTKMAGGRRSVLMGVLKWKV